ncbi:hypothetical protein K1719_034348 [Acacia pycnantha]|nr:hypothetical protein K1719_034348 [Acacia pycnantha]
MIFMGFSENACLLLAFLIYMFTFMLLVNGVGTIAPFVLIQEPETVSSNDGMFTLGFFRPRNSTNHYLGIWLMSESSVVWVVWSTNVSISSNSSAQLLDSGNLVLIDKTTGAFLWQSFQHPDNTLLQNMKFSTNKKTGEKMQLTSWESTSDPSYGGFSCSLEPRNVTEVFVWKENQPYWRSGPWNGTHFLGVPQSSSMSLNEFQIKGDQGGSFDLYFHYADKSALLTLKLGHKGKLKTQRWNSHSKLWEREWVSENSVCDIYGKCGSFGICSSLSSPICSCLRGFEPNNREEWRRQNWTSGCVRREALQCERDNNGSQASESDGFLKLERVKLPDHAEVLPFKFEYAADCQTRCAKNCSCIAYAYEKSLGCMVWTVDLLDIQSFSVGGVDLFIRLVNSELGKARRKMTTPIIISALMQILDRRRISNLKQVHNQDLSLFDFRKLAIATNNFELANKLGQGGFGPVYKGKFEDGQEIAVKRLSRSSGQGIEEFINEVELISKLQHRNLVKLLGCCIERDEEILVYEYMTNKSLDAYIFDPLQQKHLDWERRFNIIEGIARGLLYLHRDSRLRIIHRDLKASKILLDEGMNPKISDFGMAKLFGGSQDQANTERIVGTYGYISPNMQLKDSIRRNLIFYEDTESLTLLGFAWKLWINANVLPLIDPQIYDPNFQKDILRCTHIGLLCVQELAKDRPTMASVMSMIQSEIVDIPLPSQPAFILRQTMSHATEQTPSNNGLFSVNKVVSSQNLNPLSRDPFRFSQLCNPSTIWLRTHGMVIIPRKIAIQS